VPVLPIRGIMRNQDANTRLPRLRGFCAPAGNSGLRRSAASCRASWIVCFSATRISALKLPFLPPLTPRPPSARIPSCLHYLPLYDALMLRCRTCSRGINSRIHGVFSLVSSSPSLSLSLSLYLLIRPFRGFCSRLRTWETEF